MDCGGRGIHPPVPTAHVFLVLKISDIKMDNAKSPLPKRDGLHLHFYLSEVHGFDM